MNYAFQDKISKGINIYCDLIGKYGVCYNVALLFHQHFGETLSTQAESRISLLLSEPLHLCFKVYVFMFFRVRLFHIFF
jgi:hypothetical protein